MTSESAPPSGCTWGRYVDELCVASGGLTALTQLLIRRASSVTPLPDDPGSIERALRRLRTKGNGPGGQYGRWLLKYFGVPRPLVEIAKWMGQYHSRFSDLPLALRASQLWLWDRPPIAESSAAVWIHLGLASVALAEGDTDGALERLSRTRRPSESAEAEMEAALLEARLSSDRGQPVDAPLDRAEVLLAEVPGGVDHDCYRARLLDQRAYALAHQRPPKLEAARALYASIDEASTPFVAFRRNHGLAFCDWKLGRKRRALTEARAAVAHAGDAGLLRFREQALRLLAHLSPREAKPLRRRAAAIALSLRVTEAS